MTTGTGWHSVVSTVAERYLLAIAPFAMEYLGLTQLIDGFVVS
jgi:hypothetical protein